MTGLSSHEVEEDVNAPPPQIQAAIKNNDIGNLLDLDWDEAPASPTVAESPRSPVSGGAGSSGAGSTMADLLSLGGPSGGPSQAPPSNDGGKKNDVNDIMSLFNAPSMQQPQFQASPSFQSQQPAFQQSPSFQQSPTVANNGGFGGDLFDALGGGSPAPATPSPPIQAQPQQPQQQNQPAKDPFADLL